MFEVGLDPVSAPDTHSEPPDQLLRCTPEAIRIDNRPELVSLAFTEWVATKSIAVRYIQPGKPNQNAFIERFKRIYRTEVLDAHLFASLKQV